MNEPSASEMATPNRFQATRMQPNGEVADEIAWCNGAASERA
jgi:hypothetical protein